MNYDVFNAQCQFTGGSRILQSHRQQQGTAALLTCRYVDPLKHVYAELYLLIKGVIVIFGPLVDYNAISE